MTHGRFSLPGMTQSYRIRPVETWLAARNDYLSGLTAETVCHRYDLSLAAFRKRAQRHGWRRVDQPPVPPRQVDLTIYDHMTPEEEVDMARRRYYRALEHGSSADAIRWRKYWHELRAEFEATEAEIFAGMTPDEIDDCKDSIISTEEDALDKALAAAPWPDMDTPQPAPAPALAPSPAEAAGQNVHFVDSEISAPTDGPPDRDAPRLSAAGPETRFEPEAGPAPSPPPVPPREPPQAILNRQKLEASQKAWEKQIAKARNLTSRQSLKASTSPVACPPDTTAPPAMA